MKALRSQFVAGILTGVAVCMIVLAIHHVSTEDNKEITIYSNIKQSDVPAARGVPAVGNGDGVVKNAIQNVEGLLPAHSDVHQEDDTSMADYLFEKVRVLCWVMTSPDNLQKKAIHVYKTWAHKCNKIVFVSSQENSTFPAPVIRVETEEGRQHLTAKTMHAFKYVYDTYFDDADWFMKADDDTFAIMENLRYFLSEKSPADPVYYGHHFKTIVRPQGYYSGGGGYVLSKEALRKFIEVGFHDNSKCREDGGAEDAEFGKCMQNLGVKTQDSYDDRGASRFHCFNPGTHIHGGYPDWYLQYDSHGAKFGVHTVSDYAITFHYVNPQEMYSLAWYTYHLKVYGVSFKNKPQLNSYYLGNNPVIVKQKGKP